ncbi:hypothetical protein ACOSQ4_008669 [Xanthoceras sorbifolium]
MEPIRPCIFKRHALLLELQWHSGVQIMRKLCGLHGCEAEGGGGDPKEKSGGEIKKGTVLFFRESKTQIWGACCDLWTKQSIDCGASYTDYDFRSWNLDNHRDLDGVILETFSETGGNISSVMLGGSVSIAFKV